MTVVRYPAFALRDDVACRPDQAAVFYPRGYGAGCESVRKAKRICRRCPAAADCLLWALTRNENDGIWGGTTPRERDVLLRHNRELLRNSPPVGHPRKLEGL